MVREIPRRLASESMIKWPTLEDGRIKRALVAFNVSN